MFGCTRCRQSAARDARSTAKTQKYQEESTPCAPVIDAEKSNEALLMVSLIRRRPGPGFMACAGERQVVCQRK
jgi:hypothetical protein